MTKNNFLFALQDRLSNLPQDDVKDRLTFYSEMIDDRIEEGLTEKDAVSAVGSIDEIVAQIVADIPLVTLAKEKMKPTKHLNPWAIVLLVLGSPLWIPLLIAAFAGFASGVGFLFVNVLTGLAIIGGGLFCTGLSIFLFCGCKAATKGIAILTKKIALGIKKSLVKKEAA